jgi:uncharacterized lipoprotein YajG
MYLVRCWLVGLLAVGTVGCVFFSQEVTLTPKVQTAAPVNGRGLAVRVHAVDERPKKDFGRRSNAADQFAAIRSEQDVASVVRDAVANGLTQLGFAPTQESTAPRSLRIEIRDVAYSTSRGWTLYVQTNAAVKAFADNGKAQYENFYRATVEDWPFWGATASYNEQQINLAVNAVLQQVFADRVLLEHLAAE